jgi:alpha-beta hydrolase superfamily lysophospholipase
VCVLSVKMDDLQAAVNYLRTQKLISRIGLWGRSMGAVTSLRYGAQDPSIAGMVLDSPFSNLNDLMMELVDVYKIRLPKFTVYSTSETHSTCSCCAHRTR